MPAVCRNLSEDNTHTCVHIQDNISKYSHWDINRLYFEIKNRLLIIVYKTHVYVHDLVRHNIKTNPFAIQTDRNKKALLGIISFS